MKPAQKGTQKSAKSTTATSKKFKGFTDEEHGAMRDRIQELRGDKADGESAVLAKIAEMPEPDRTMAKRLHAIIKETAQPSRRDSGTGCPHMPRPARAARSAASSKQSRRSKPGTQRS